MIELIRRITNLEEELDKLVKPEVGRWVAWTPTVTQGVSVTATVSYARCILSNNTVTLTTLLTATSAGTAGTAIVVSGLPYSIANTSAFSAIGSGVIVDAGVAVYAGIAVAAGANDIRVIYPGSNYIGVIPNFALANTDVISIAATYEVA